MSEAAAAAASDGTAAPAAADTSASAGAATETAASGADTVAGATGADSVAAGAASDLIRPEGLPDELWDAASGVKVGDLWSAYRDLKAQTEAATGDAPTDLAGYGLAVPEGVTLPEGVTVEALSKDPFFAAAQQVALDAKLPKGVFDKFAGAYLSDIVAFHKEQDETRAAAYVEAKKALGENVDKRVEAAKNWLTANLSKAQADAIMTAGFNPDLIKGLEAIIAMRSGPAPGQGGGGNVSQFEGLRGGDLLTALRTAKAA